MPGPDPGIHVFLSSDRNVDGRVEPGHDKYWEIVAYGSTEIGEKSMNQLFGCTTPLTFGLIARGPTSWAT